MDDCASKITIQGFRCNGDCSILIDFPVSVDLLANIHAFAEELRQNPFPDQLNVVPATTTLMLSFTAPIQDWSGLENQLQKLYAGQDSHIHSAATHIIPVCYQPELATDMEAVLTTSRLSHEELVKIHSGREYLVSMLGFLPGFMYLDELDSRLVMPRKATPVVDLPAGSIAIAGNQCGIYALSSPGGWHVIGRTPLQLVNWTDAEPIKIRAMDKLSFKPISLEEFICIEQAAML